MLFALIYVFMYVCWYEFWYFMSEFISFPWNLLNLMLPNYGHLQNFKVTRNWIKKFVNLIFILEVRKYLSRW